MESSIPSVLHFKKMKNSRIFLAAAIIVASAFAGCKKDKEEETPIVPSTPEITFEVTNPTAGAMYHLGDTVWVDVHITSDTELHGYEANLINTSDSDAVLWEDHLHDHGMEYHIHGFYVNGVTMHSDVELSIDAFIDHDGASENHTVAIHCHPM